MNNRILYTIVVLLFLSGSIYSQNFENLKIKEEKKYKPRLLFRNIFGTYNNTLLFRSQEFSYRGEKVEYYVLDADSNRISDINFQNTGYLPLAFLNNDTIVLKREQEEKWVFFSISQNKYINDIPKNLNALLAKIPSGIDEDKYVCKFEKSMNQMILFDNSYSPILEMYCYNADKELVEKKEFNIDKLCSSCAIVNVHWVDSDRLLLCLFNNMTERYTYCFYNIINDQTDKINFFNRYNSLDDYFDGYCLVRFFDSRPYRAAIYSIDTKSMELVLEYQIYADIKNERPLYRLGFVSPTKIARMTIGGADFVEFQPLLNQIANLFAIRFEKVDK